MKLMMSTGLSLAISALLACGGGDSEGDNPYGLLGVPPSETVFCSLAIGESTRAEVLETLGAPTSAVQGTTTASADYWYRDPKKSPGVGDITALSLSFDERDVFVDVTVVNLPLPSCWREQIAQRTSRFDGDLED